MSAPDEIIHQSTRLRVMSALNALPRREMLEFKRLRVITGATDGNLGAHLTTLERGGVRADRQGFRGQEAEDSRSESPCTGTACLPEPCHLLARNPGRRHRRYLNGRELRDGKHEHASTLGWTDFRLHGSGDIIPSGGRGLCPRAASLRDRIVVSDRPGRAGMTDQSGHSAGTLYVLFHRDRTAPARTNEVRIDHQAERWLTRRGNSAPCPMIVPSNREK